MCEESDCVSMPGCERVENREREERGCNSEQPADPVHYLNFLNACFISRLTMRSCAIATADLHTSVCAG